MAEDRNQAGKDEPDLVPYDTFVEVFSKYLPVRCDLHGLQIHDRSRREQEHVNYWATSGTQELIRSVVDQINPTCDKARKMRQLLSCICLVNVTLFLSSLTTALSQRPVSLVEFPKEIYSRSRLVVVK